MSNAMLTAFRKVRLRPNEKLVAMVLADRHNSRTNRCDVSIPTIVSETGLSRRAVIRNLQSMDGKCLTVHRTDGVKNWYELHPSTSAAVTPVDQCRSGTGAAVTPVPLETGTSAIGDIDLYKESKESTPNTETAELFHLEASEKKAASKPHREESKKASAVPPPDPRFHAITSRIGEVCRTVTGKPLSFNGSFASALKNFLKGWAGTPDEWLEMYADVLALATRPYARYTVDACDPAKLCRNWNAVSGEVDKLKADEEREGQSKRTKFKGI